MRISLPFLLSGLLLCSCTHPKPPFHAKPYELPSYPPAATVPPRGEIPPEAPRATSPGPDAGGASGGSGSGSGSGSSTGAAGGGGGGGSSQSSASAGSSQGSAGSTISPSTGDPGETRAGAGHVAPLGDKLRTKPLAEEELRISGAEQHGSEPAAKPSAQPEPDPASAVERPTPPATPVPQVEVKPEDIERLPPERRAALLRYMKQIQAQRAATQPAEGQR